jgi:uracil-DNA glycosylase
MTAPTDVQIDTFIDLLANTPTNDDAYNEYAPPDSNNAIRRANLKLYLQAMAERMPQTMMVMEAPGYRGCRLTGVPVMSRKVLLEGIATLGMFGTDQGFQNVDDAGFERIYGEQSATIVWGTLTDLEVVPFIWNTFPFHPHKKELPLTNRKPRKPETRLGGEILKQLMALWQFEQIIAIGNVAYDTLTEFGVDCVKVRHPAQGGKNDFVAGLTDIFDNHKATKILTTKTQRTQRTQRKK